MLTIEKVHAGKNHQHENSLIHETSPYLLQHAHNPVNWMAWSDAAFEKAKKENKPILLSVGYSTCHWCHAMEHESFEDDEIASVLNQNYVAIKVDREQRPDVDSLFMTVVQGMTGHGGWPMTVWLTPDQTPFYAGTYFPARDGDRGGHPGFLDLLRRLADLFKNNSKDILDRASQISQQIAKQVEVDQSGSLPSKKALDDAFFQLAQNYDHRTGGFGFAPKFPRPSTLDFLLHYADANHSDEAKDMVLGTLTGMIRGGIYDHLGGGFHRYSVDAYWLVPHFEKMLYDQSQIVMSLLYGFQISNNNEFKIAAIETLDYVLREMTDSKGGFYSATDADSEGEEGKFFVWTLDEIQKNIDPKIKDLFCEYYDVTPHGNFEGHTILHTQETLESFAKKKNLDVVILTKQFEDAKQKLLDIRSTRVPPLTDDKIIVSWNGLMIAALAKASLILNRSDYALAAEKSAEFILNQMSDQIGLHRSTRSGKLSGPAFLDDYSCFVYGLLALFETTGNTKWLTQAKILQDDMNHKFWDQNKGGYFASANPKFFAREKPFYDGAEPSGNSIAAENLLKLAAFLQIDEYKNLAKKIFEVFSQTIERNPTFCLQLLSSLDQYHRGLLEIIIVDTNDGKFESLVNEVRQIYIANRVLILSKANPTDPFSLIPLLQEKLAVRTSTAYVCKDYVCQAPASDPKLFQKQLKNG